MSTAYKIWRTNFWHESLILILYIFLGPFVFSIFYKGDRGEVIGMAYILILFVSLGISLVLLIVMLIFKIKVKNKIFELLYGIIPLLPSFVCFFHFMACWLDADCLTGDPALSAYGISNTLIVITLYGISIYYKLYRGKRDDGFGLD